MTIAVTGNSRNVEYDGYYKEVSGVSFAIAADSLNTKLFDASRAGVANNADTSVGSTNVGIYVRNFVASDFVYDDANVSAEFVAGDTTLEEGIVAQNKVTITKRLLTINATAYKQADQSTLVHNIKSAEVDGSVADQVITGTIETNSAEVGTYRLTNLKTTVKVDGTIIAQPEADNDNLLTAIQKAFADEGEANYEISNESTLTIFEPPVANTVYITGRSKTIDYDGASHSLDATSFSDGKTYNVTANFSDFDESNLTVTSSTISDKTDAGTYEASNIAGTYSGAAVEVVNNPKLIIRQKSVLSDSITASGTSSFEYTGKTQKPTDITVLDGNTDVTDQFDFEYVDDSLSINPGNYTVTITAKDSSNYSGSTTFAYTITRATRTVKINGTHETVTYNSMQQTASGYTITEYYADGTTEVAQSDQLIVADSITPPSANCTVSGTDVGVYVMGLGNFSYDNSNSAFIIINN